MTQTSRYKNGGQDCGYWDIDVDTIDNEWWHGSQKHVQQTHEPLLEILSHIVLLAQGKMILPPYGGATAAANHADHFRPACSGDINFCKLWVPNLGFWQRVFCFTCSFDLYFLKQKFPKFVLIFFISQPNFEMYLRVVFIIATKFPKIMNVIRNLSHISKAVFELFLEF